jgi:hypothetical protein
MNRQPRSKRSHFRSRFGQGGQVLIMLLTFLLPVTVITFSVYNVGVVVAEKMKLQNAADNAAYSAATFDARYMNLNAYINRTMISNYDTMATLVAVWSFIDALDGFAYLAHFIIRLIPIINALDAIFAPLHVAVHTADSAIAQGVGGNKDSSRSTRLLELIEKYNLALSAAQKGLYILTQSGRGSLVQAIARGVDPKVDSWVTAEVGMNLQSLDDRRRYEGSKDTQNSGDMSDKDKGIRLTFERSLNFFSNGDGFRDLSPPNPIPCLKIQIGEKGYNGGGFTDHENGTGSTQENDPGGNPVQIVKNTEIYQLDEGGIKVGWDCIVDFDIIDLGHKSDDKFNLPNAANESVPHFFDTNDGADQGHSDNNIEPNMPSSGGCDSGTGGVSSSSGSTPTPEEIQLSQNCQNNVDTRFVPGLPPRKEVLTNPPETDPAKQVWADCKAIGDSIKAKSGGSTGSFTAATNPCAVKYVFDKPLDEVEVATYSREKETDPVGTRTVGPKVYVHLRKQFGRLPLLMGGDMGTLPGSIFDMEARSFGQAYYTQRRPGATPDDKKKESLFNPFWAGRLEKLP